MVCFIECEHFGGPASAHTVLIVRSKALSLWVGIEGSVQRFEPRNRVATIFHSQGTFESVRATVEIKQLILALQQVSQKTYLVWSAASFNFKKILLVHSGRIR